MIGFVSYPIDDSDNRQIAKVVTHSKQYPTMTIYPYGMAANAPAMTSHALTLALSGSVRNSVSMCFSQKNRLKNLAEGEVALFNEKARNSVYLKKDGIIIKNESGNIVITNQGAELVIQKDKIVSNVPIEAPDYVGPSDSIAIASKGVNSGDSPLIASNIAMNGHVHGGVKAGDDESGAPK